MESASIRQQRMRVLRSPICPWAVYRVPVDDGGAPRNAQGVEMDEDDANMAAGLDPYHALINESIARYGEAVYWERFYRNNGANFFKDRHYLWQEFPVLLPTGCPRNMLEVGGGVGNTLFPLMDRDPLLRGYLCDFSETAIEHVLLRAEKEGKAVTAFVHDIAKDGFHPSLKHIMDIASLVFVVSAVHHDKQKTAVENVSTTLRKGGTLILRDYALGDMAEMRLEKDANSVADIKRARDETDWEIRHKFGQMSLTKDKDGRGYDIVDIDWEKMRENPPPKKLENSRLHRVRGDGTRTFFFCAYEIGKMLSDSGFRINKLQIIDTKRHNRKKELTMDRRWIQVVAEKL